MEALPLKDSTVELARPKVNFGDPPTRQWRGLVSVDSPLPELALAAGKLTLRSRNVRRPGLMHISSFRCRLSSGTLQ
jgi:hypothetical protein